MKYITVKDATVKAIAGRARGPFVSTGVRLANGDWKIPVDDDTFDALIRYAGGAQIDIAVRRLCVDNQRKEAAGIEPAPATDEPTS